MSTESPLKKHRDNGAEILFCWGSHSYGQLGLGNEIDDQILLPKESIAYQNRHVRDISCGEHHTVMVQNDGSVYSCGGNDSLELGHNKGKSKYFERIDILETQNIKKVTCGTGYNIALNESGQLLAWGKNTHGQLGIGFTDETCVRTPKLIKSLERHRVIQVACGCDHCIVLTEAGLLFTWGQNQYGQLGIGQDVNSVDQAVQIQSLQGLPLYQIAAGANHTFVVTLSGALFGWGRNSCGQVGVGDQIDKYYPTHVKTLRSQKVIYVACGEEHTLALTKEGRVFTFGSGKYGQLGHNSLNEEHLPRQVFELTGSTVTQIACGRRHSIAYVASHGKIYGFGLGASGQLGMGNLLKHKSPQVVQGPFEASSNAFKVKQDRLFAYSVRHIYAGGDQCFVVASNAKAGIPADDLRLGNDELQIPVLTEETIRQFSSFPPSSKLPNEVKVEVDKRFSSASCINGSFLLQGDEHFDCSKKNHGVDFEEAKNFFSRLQNLPNHTIIEYVHDCLQTNLFPSLQTGPPDVEALRLYLSLPLLSGFDNPANMAKVIVPFGKAVVSLQKSAAKVIDRWWETLLPESFERLIKIYKQAVVHVLFLPKARNDFENHSFGVKSDKNMENLYKQTYIHQHINDNKKSPNEEKTIMSRQRQRSVHVCMEVLLKLNKINNENSMHFQIVNYDKFYIRELTEHIDIRMEYLKWIQQQGKTEELLYCHYPFVFDAKAKTMLLHTDAILQMQSAVDEATRRNLVGLFLAQIDPINPCLVLFVHRDRLVEDTIGQLQKQRSKDFKKPLKVKFDGEEAQDAGGVRKVIFLGEDAVDEGGVRKEFFMLLLQEVMHPKFGMFKYYEDSRLMWFNESTFEVPAYFHLIGVLCGLAIYNNVIIDLGFPLALYKKLLKRPVLLEDLKELQPVIGKSLESVLQYDGDDIVDVFCLTFEVTKDVFGQTIQVPLVENGSNKNVTKENRQEYVDAYIDYVFNTSVNTQFHAFYDGFHRVCGGKVLELFHPQELQEMVVGNENYDWEELEKNTEYKGVYHRNHQVIIWFWEIFKGLSDEFKRKYLLFLTGSDRIPIHGMKVIKMYIQPVEGGEHYLPVAHTCFNLLDLPKYTSNSLMKEKLLLAIAHCQGFALV